MLNLIIGTLMNLYLIIAKVMRSLGISIKFHIILGAPVFLFPSKASFRPTFLWRNRLLGNFSFL